MDTYTLYNGNCLDELRQIKDKSIDLILTDPPYIISRETNEGVMRPNMALFLWILENGIKNPLNLKLL